MTIKFPKELIVGRDEPFTFADIKKMVVENGYGRVNFEHNGNNAAMSHGIDYTQ